MTTLTIERTFEDGNPQINVYLGGVKTSFNNRLSRFLTNTSHEEANGIFTRSSCPVYFYRGPERVLIEFDSPWSPENKCIKELMLEIIQRVIQVEVAFKTVELEARESASASFPLVAFSECAEMIVTI